MAFKRSWVRLPPSPHPIDPGNPVFMRISGFLYASKKCSPRGKKCSPTRKKSLCPNHFCALCRFFYFQSAVGAVHIDLVCLLHAYPLSIINLEFNRYKQFNERLIVCQEDFRYDVSIRYLVAYLFRIFYNDGKVIDGERNTLKWRKKSRCRIIITMRSMKKRSCPAFRKTVRFAWWQTP